MRIALGKIKDKRATEILSIMVNDKDFYVQESARWALKEISAKNH